MALNPVGVTVARDVGDMYPYAVAKSLPIIAFQRAVARSVTTLTFSSSGELGLNVAHAAVNSAKTTTAKYRISQLIAATRPTSLLLCRII
jgi:hypothetical protein